MIAILGYWQSPFLLVRILVRQGMLEDVFLPSSTVSRLQALRGFQMPSLEACCKNISEAILPASFREAKVVKVTVIYQEGEQDAVVKLFFHV